LIQPFHIQIKFQPAPMQSLIDKRRAEQTK
jgi:hypothetical protein